MWKTIAGGVAVALFLGIGGYSMYRPGELQKVVQTEHRLSGSPIAIPFGIGAPTSMWDSLKGQSVVKEFDRLDALAKAGDGKAALDAFHLTNYCGFTDSLKIVQKQTPMPELAQQIQVVTEACTGMTEDKIGRRSALVKQAAEAGVKNASSYYLSGGLPLDHDYRNVADVVGQQLKAEAVEYVRRDAMAGDVTALMTLGQMYEFNVLEEYNAQKSLAYILASMEVLTANPDQVPQGKNVLAILKEGVGNYERGMTDDQKKAAHAEARELIKQIKHS